MLSKSEAIVLRSVRYGDRQFIVDMFSREHGRLQFALMLNNAPRARFRKNLFQPLTLLTIEADIRQQASLPRLRDASMLVPLASLHSEPGKLAIALFVAEFLHHALKGEQRDVSLFDYVKAGIAWLDGSQGGYANFHLTFLMHLSRFLGFFPNLDPSEGRYFDLRAATFCTVPPPHHDFLEPAEAGRLRLLMRMDYANMHLFRMSHTDRQRVLQVIERYYRLHLPAFPELRSPAVLHELF